MKVLCLDNGRDDPCYVTKNKTYKDLNRVVRDLLIPPHLTKCHIRVWIMPENLSVTQFHCYNVLANGIVDDNRVVCFNFLWEEAEEV